VTLRTLAGIFSDQLRRRTRRNVDGNLRVSSNPESADSLTRKANHSHLALGAVVPKAPSEPTRVKTADARQGWLNGTTMFIVFAVDIAALDFSRDRLAETGQPHGIAFLSEGRWLSGHAQV
jgi:hypothetical protein